MTAPDRIALRWELGAAVTSGPLMDHPDYTQYVRADLEPVAAPDPAAIREAARVLLADEKATYRMAEAALDLEHTEQDFEAARQIMRDALFALIPTKGTADDRA